MTSITEQETDNGSGQNIQHDFGIGVGDQVGRPESSGAPEINEDRASVTEEESAPKIEEGLSAYGAAQAGIAHLLELVGAKVVVAPGRQNPAPIVDIISKKKYRVQGLLSLPGKNAPAIGQARFEKFVYANTPGEAMEKYGIQDIGMALQVRDRGTIWQVNMPLPKCDEDLERSDVRYLLVQEAGREEDQRSQDEVSRNPYVGSYWQEKKSDEVVCVSGTPEFRSDSGNQADGDRMVCYLYRGKEFVVDENEFEARFIMLPWRLA